MALTGDTNDNNEPQPDTGREGLTPLYFEPGTHVTVRAGGGWIIDRFRIQGKKVDTVYRAIGFDLPKQVDFGDMRRWLGGRRFPLHRQEANPDFPKPGDPQPVDTPNGTWRPVGYVTCPAVAKKKGGEPINTCEPLMFSPAACDVAMSHRQRGL